MIALRSMLTKTKRLPTLTTILSLCFAAAAQADDPLTKLTANSWELFLLSASEGSDTSNSPLTDYNRQLLYLTDIADTREGSLLYSSLIIEIGKLNDPSSLPALEKVINHAAGGFPSGSVLIANAVQTQASSAWYKIICRDASLDEKIDYALYGFDPHSPVNIDPSLAAEQIDAVGAPARKKLYDLFRRKDNDYDGQDDDVSLARASELLSSSAFEPTDAEIQAILDQEGRFGKAVMIRYLAVLKQDKRAVPAIISWIETTEDLDLVDSMMSQVYKYRDPSDDEKERLISVMVAKARAIMESFGHNDGFDAYATLDLLSTTHLMLRELGPNVTSKAYFADFVEFSNTIDWRVLRRHFENNTDHTYVALNRIETATRIANTALAEW